MSHPGVAACGRSCLGSQLVARAAAWSVHVCPSCPAQILHDAHSATSPPPVPQALLETQLAGCARQLAVVQWEHEYIKDQLTTTEVRAGPGLGALLCRVGLLMRVWETVAEVLRRECSLARDPPSIHVRRNWAQQDFQRDSLLDFLVDSAAL